jgi:hypothetical protein
MATTTTGVSTSSAALFYRLGFERLVPANAFALITLRSVIVMRPLQ